MATLRSANETVVMSADSTTGEGKNFTGGLLGKGEIIGAKEGNPGWKVIDMLRTQSGEAEIYLAKNLGLENDETDDAEVKIDVIKYYKDLHKPKTDILERFKALNHPDIIKIYDFGVHDTGHFYEIMEYAKNGSLDKQGKDGSYEYLPMEEEDVKGIVRQMVNAFNTCHEKGIIHRDIKPANIFFRDLGTMDVIVGDFGISSVLDEGEQDMHKTQTTAQTAGYAPPEIFSKKLNSEKYDYYSLGITVWEMLTGKNPFVDPEGVPRNPQHIERQTIFGQVPEDLITKDKETDKKISAYMEKLIRGLLHNDPDDRWGFEQVIAYLDGKEVALKPQKRGEFSYEIDGIKAKNLEQLGKLLLEHPESARKALFSRAQVLELAVKRDDEETAQKIHAIVGKAREEEDEENGVVRVAYLLNPAMPLSIGEDDVIKNVDDIIQRLQYEPEVMGPLFKDKNSSVYAYLDAMELNRQAAEIQKLSGKASIADLTAKATVILKNKKIKPFKLALYADKELSSLEYIKRKVPSDMQKRILSLVKERNYEGLFLPWLDLLTPTIPLEEIKTDNWENFLDCIGVGKEAKKHFDEAEGYINKIAGSGPGGANSLALQIAISEYAMAVKLDPENEIYKQKLEKARARI